MTTAHASGPLLPPRFHTFTATQALGAFNDNVFRTLLQLVVLQVYVVENAEEVLATATFIFTIPFVLFGPWAGYLADTWPKNQLMRVIKLFEIPIMMLGVYAFYLGHLPLLLGVLFLMATQSTFFAPAKQGIIPEMCSPRAITHANGWVEMTTFVFIIGGIVGAGLLMNVHGGEPVWVAIYCVVIAAVGAGIAFFIPAQRAASTSARFDWNPVAGIWRDLTFLRAQKGLWLAGLANSYFWMNGMIFSTNVLVYGDRLLGLGADDSLSLAVLPAFIAVGVAVGSMLASRLSAEKVELGLVPLGGIGIAVGGIGLFFSSDSYAVTAIFLGLTGVSGGLYIVPLFSYLQFFAKEDEKGRVLSTVGILNGLFLVLGSLVYYLLTVTLGMQPDSVFLFIAGTTVFVVIYICSVIPEYFIRFSAWLLTHTIYNITIVGREAIAFRGPVLIIPNHVTFVDAFLIGSTMQRFVRYMMLKSYYDVPIVRNILNVMDVIPIAPKEGRESVAASLMQARARLLDGHVVCIFAEGALTRDGKMHEFRPGFEAVMEGLDCPIVPAYIHDAWGSIFSWKDGRAIFKWPKQIPYRVTISYGEAMSAQATAAEVEAAVRALGEDAGAGEDASAGEDAGEGVTELRVKK